ncbi:aryl-alcohol dehydrogenase-like predicted oxidoreductase [Actinoplanes campanulatus]|uniref:Aryl-alcohol dehydrogenase-like predicted oxidoreductase n=1 Tax=Actinoplanes campanulatus TaxID=113559 RepID=A0A7W5AFC7_9ACTN|nr:aldo/keto reductase [Actinoplanes campanulatus]MBB3095016.1 aryl-alcohol dehydrogenase-like predicted oxidoreductase [Actinoplanes campanulatus]GGN22856.1 oxidoreductase [Actinoplanes campanulatus]GID34621.1 oxidoreductase [Actinoplanes campanulatus]
MENRTLGRDGKHVGVIGTGAWQLGGADWGRVSEKDALDTLSAALESGATFIDTADEYGDGRSEQVIGTFLRSLARSGAARPVVATKMGRRVEQAPENYTAANFRAWLDRSRRNLGVERIDLVQLHCPPHQVYTDDAVFDALDALVEDEVIAAYGVSVRTCEQALIAMRRPRLAMIQIVLNMFRLKPLERVLPAAARSGVGVIARVPLASGLLSGRYTASTVFEASDHRSYNRHGESFDVGETFSGVDFATGLEAVDRLRPMVPPGATLAQFALRWIVDQEAVSVVIPGARTAAQARANAAAAALAPLSETTLRAVRSVYDELVREQVHHRW